MRFVSVQKIFHRMSYPQGHVLELRMFDPVSGSVLNKRDVTNIPPVNAIVQTEKNAQAGLGKDCMCRYESDVIAGDISA